MSAAVCRQPAVAERHRERSGLPQLAVRRAGASQSNVSGSHPANQEEFLQPGEPPLRARTAIAEITSAPVVILFH